MVLLGAPPALAARRARRLAYAEAAHLGQGRELSGLPALSALETMSRSSILPRLSDPWQAGGAVSEF